MEKKRRKQNAKRNFVNLLRMDFGLDSNTSSKAWKTQAMNWIVSQTGKRIVLFALIAVVIGAAMILSVTACKQSVLSSASTNRPIESLTIAFSQSGTLNQWRVTESNSIIEVAKKYGSKLIYTDAGDDVAQQNADLIWLAEQKPDYIIITPRDFYGLEEGLAAAKSANIPVIVIERNLHGTVGEDYVTVIKSDLSRQGMMCAEYMVSVFGDKPCRILEIVGSELSSPSMERSEGFRSVIHEHANYQIVATGYGNYTRGVARASIKALLEDVNVNRIDAIFAQNDDTALDAIAAVEATGAKAGENILIFSIDGSSAAIKAILTGKLAMTIDDSPYYGELVFDAIRRLEQGETLPGWIRREDGIIYDSSNAEEMLERSY